MPKQKREDDLEVAANEATAAETKADLPAVIRLTAPHAFYEEGGNFRSWALHQVVADSDEVRLLHKRGAHFVKHEV